MKLEGKKIILASGSPRRRELLSSLDIDFEVDTRNNFEEKFSPSTPHREICSVLSEGKSLGFHRPLEKDEILITSDTLVLCGDEVLGKPRSREDAIRMLSLLCGLSAQSPNGAYHEVITAVTVRTTDGIKTVKDIARVHFKTLSMEEIEYYVDIYKPFDKAGAYGIQEWIGYIGIDHIEGSFYTIMGFPVHLVYELLKEII